MLDPRENFARDVWGPDRKLRIRNREEERQMQVGSYFVVDIVCKRHPYWTMKRRPRCPSCLVLWMLKQELKQGNLTEK